MSHRHLGAVALALGLSLVGPASLAAQSADSARAPNVMATVVIHAASHRRASSKENARLKCDLARYDARIVSLSTHLDSLKMHADSLERDRLYFEAAAAQARARRAQIEQRLRDLEARTGQPADTHTP